MHRADLTPLAPLLEKLRRATRERRRVAMVYRGRGQPEPLQRDLDPYALIHRWGYWYVTGHCHLRGAVRTFRVDRIVELTLLGQAFVVPSDFDIQAYLSAEPQAQPQVQIRMRFAPEAALMALDDRAFWDSVDEQPDDSVIVTFVAPNLEWPTHVALSYGPHAVVLEPEELRRLVGERSRAIAAQYVSTE
jgi:predicted DNA-binding transcriptional regulator YafY